MTTPTPFTYLVALQAAVASAASTGPNTAKLAASLATVLADFQAAAPELAVLAVNTGINDAAKAVPILGILVPAETVIDPLVDGMASHFENWVLGKLGVPQS